MSPLSEERLASVVDAIGEPGPRALDLGCGKGALLRRLAIRCPIEGRGIERSEALVIEARRRADAARLKGRLSFEVADLSGFQPSETQDLVICMGASGALGRFSDALQQLCEWVSPGGLLLVDSGYWKRRPDPQYLAVLGATEDSHADEAMPIRLAESLGLSLRACWRATLEEWDEFEDAYATAVERETAGKLADPASAKRAAWIRSWREAYATWGRETLGWGLYLFRKAVGPQPMTSSS